MKTIGLIGLGHIGNPMAQNLLKAGFTVYVYDINPDTINALTQFGAKESDSLATLAEVSDMVITSLQTGQQVRETCLHHDGLFSHLSPKKIFVDTSSIDITTTHELHTEANKLHIPMLDAPVSGGVAGARAATLTFMVGGQIEYFELVKPVLQFLGKKIIHAGAEGSGQAAKICNNLLLGISMIGVSEAFTLAKKLGVSPKKFFEISSNASGQCWSMTNYCPVPNIVDNVPSNNNYEPGFMAKMMLKDLRLARDAAEMTDTATPLGAIATELYELYVNQGFGEKDFSGIIKFIDCE